MSDRIYPGPFNQQQPDVDDLEATPNAHGRSSADQFDGNKMIEPEIIMAADNLACVPGGGEHKTHKSPGTNDSVGIPINHYSPNQVYPYPNTPLSEDQKYNQVKPKKQIPRYVLKLIARKQTAFCFGVLNTNDSILANIYRLFVAFLLLPCTLTSLFLALIVRLSRRGWALLERKCCENSNFGASVLEKGLERAAASDHLTRCCCNCTVILTCCFKTQDCIESCCGKCSGVWVGCFSFIGGAFGKCFEFIGSNFCGLLGGIGGLFTGCLEWGKGLWESCAGGMGGVVAKICGLGTEYIGKCISSAGRCYEVVLQCHCPCDCCGSLHEWICGCGNIDFSSCVDWISGCFGGAIGTVFELLQGVFTHLVEVLGVIIENIGNAFECIIDYIK